MSNGLTLGDLAAQDLLEFFCDLPIKSVEDIPIYGALHTECLLLVPHPRRLEVVQEMSPMTISNRKFACDVENTFHVLPLPYSNTIEPLGVTHPDHGNDGFTLLVEEHFHLVPGDLALASVAP